jgi:hypothetical protein
MSRRETVGWVVKDSRDGTYYASPVHYGSRWSKDRKQTLAFAKRRQAEKIAAVQGSLAWAMRVVRLVRKR